MTYTAGTDSRYQIGVSFIRLRLALSEPGTQHPRSSHGNTHTHRHFDLGPGIRGGTTRRGRWWALAALVLCVLAVGLDGTVLTVALPTLAGALRAGESELQWFTSGYLLVLAAAMLPAGQLADRFGRKTVLLCSLGLFAAGSAACAFATGPGWFIAARVLLGLGGAGVIVSALAVLTVLFDEDERPRAVGLFSAANFLSLPLGPLLGGWVLAHAWWGWVFLINVPLAAVGLVAGWALIPSSRVPPADGTGCAWDRGVRHRPDVADAWAHRGRPARLDRRVRRVVHGARACGGSARSFCWSAGPRGREAPRWWTRRCSTTGPTPGA